MEVSSDMMKEEWYVNSLMNPMPVLNPLRKQNFSLDGMDDWVISVSREITDTNGENLGVLLIDVKYQALHEYLQNQETGKNSDIVILDEDNRIVYYKEIPYDTSQEKYLKELDRLGKDTLNLGFTKLSYADAKRKEMKLGLDLRGGINVLLEINQRDLVNNLTNYSTNPILIETLERTDKAQRNSTKTYIEDFFTQFDIVNKEKGANLKLSSPEVFGTQNLSQEIKFNTTDQEVKNIITKKINESISSAYEVIRTRIDKMGVTQPNVQQVPGTGRILVEMPGIKDIDRVKQLLQTSAKLQFWEVQQIDEVAPYLEKIASVVAAKGDSMGVQNNFNFITY